MASTRSINAPQEQSQQELNVFTNAATILQTYHTTSSLNSNISAQDGLIAMLSKVQPIKYYTTQGSYSESIRTIACSIQYRQCNPAELVIHRPISDSFFIILSGTVHVYIPKLIEEIQEEQSIQEEIQSLKAKLNELDTHLLQYSKTQKRIKALKKYLLKYNNEQDEVLIAQNQNMQNIFFLGNSKVSQFKYITELKQGDVLGKREWTESSKKVYSYLCSSNCELAAIDNYLFTSLLEKEKNREVKRCIESLHWCDNNEDYDFLSAWFQERSIERKESLFKIDSPTEEVYIVKQGQLAIYKTTEQQVIAPSEELVLLNQVLKKGEVVHLAILEKGDVFGYEDLKEKKRTYGVVCSTGDTILYQINVKLLKEIVKDPGKRLIVKKGILKRDWIQARFEEVQQMKSIKDKLLAQQGKKQLKRNKPNNQEIQMQQNKQHSQGGDEEEQKQGSQLLSQQQLSPMQSPRRIRNLPQLPLFKNASSQGNSDQNTSMEDISPGLSPGLSPKSRGRYQQYMGSQQSLSSCSPTSFKDNMDLCSPTVPQKSGMQQKIFSLILQKQLTELNEIKSNKNINLADQEKRNITTPTDGGGAARTAYLNRINTLNVPKLQSLPKTTVTAKNRKINKSCTQSYSSEQQFKSISGSQEILDQHQQFTAEEERLNEVNKQFIASQQQQQQQQFQENHPNFQFFAPGMSFDIARNWVVQSKNMKKRLPPAETPVFNNSKPDYADIISYCVSKQEENKGNQDKQRNIEHTPETDEMNKDANNFSNGRHKLLKLSLLRRNSSLEAERTIQLSPEIALRKTVSSQVSEKQRDKYQNQDALVGRSQGQVLIRAQTSNWSESFSCCSDSKKNRQRQQYREGGGQGQESSPGEEEQGGGVVQRISLSKFSKQIGQSTEQSQQQQHDKQNKLDRSSRRLSFSQACLSLNVSGRQSSLHSNVDVNQSQQRIKLANANNNIPKKSKSVSKLNQILSKESMQLTGQQEYSAYIDSSHPASQKITAGEPWKGGQTITTKNKVASLSQSSKSLYDPDLDALREYVAIEKQLSKKQDSYLIKKKRINSDTIDFEGQFNKEKGDIQNKSNVLISVEQCRKQEKSNENGCINAKESSYKDYYHLNNNTNSGRLNSLDISENNKDNFKPNSDNKSHMLMKATDYLQSPSDLIQQQQLLMKITTQQLKGSSNPTSPERTISTPTKITKQSASGISNPSSLRRKDNYYQSQTTSKQSSLASLLGRTERGSFKELKNKNSPEGRIQSMKAINSTTQTSLLHETKRKNIDNNNNRISNMVKYIEASQCQNKHNEISRDEKLDNNRNSIQDDQESIRIGQLVESNQNVFPSGKVLITPLGLQKRRDPHCLQETAQLLDLTTNVGIPKTANEDHGRSRSSGNATGGCRSSYSIFQTNVESSNVDNNENSSNMNNSNIGSIQWNSQLQFRRTLTSIGAKRIQKNFSKLLKAENAMTISPSRMRYIGKKNDTTKNNNNSNNTSSSRKYSQDNSSKRQYINTNKTIVGTETREDSAEINRPRNFRETLERALLGRNKQSKTDNNTNTNNTKDTNLQGKKAKIITETERAQKNHQSTEAQVIEKQQMKQSLAQEKQKSQQDRNIKRKVNELGQCQNQQVTLLQSAFQIEKIHRKLRHKRAESTGNNNTINTAKDIKTASTANIKVKLNKSLQDNTNAHVSDNLSLIANNKAVPQSSNIMATTTSVKGNNLSSQSAQQKVIDVMVVSKKEKKVKTEGTIKRATYLELKTTATLMSSNESIISTTQLSFNKSKETNVYQNNNNTTKNSSVEAKGSTPHAEIARQSAYFQLSQQHQQQRQQAIQKNKQW